MRDSSFCDEHGLLINPTNASPPLLCRKHTAARTFGLQLHVLHASSERF
jgi:hypothetical protein